MSASLKNSFVNIEKYLPASEIEARKKTTENINKFLVFVAEKHFAKNESVTLSISEISKHLNISDLAEVEDIISLAITQGHLEGEIDNDNVVVRSVTPVHNLRKEDWINLKDKIESMISNVNMLREIINNNNQSAPTTSE